MNEKISYEGKRFLKFLFNMEQQCGQHAKLAKYVENLKNHKGKDVYPCKNQENAQKKIVMVKIFIKVDVFFEVGIWNKILNMMKEIVLLIKCEVCGYTFSSIRKLKTHMRTKHEWKW